MDRLPKVSPRQYVASPRQNDDDGANQQRGPVSPGQKRRYGTAMAMNPLIPELYCSDFQRSLKFYTDILGFRLAYARPEERFAFLEREGAQLMIEQSTNPARTWLTGELSPPYGRGINFQIAVSDVDALYAAVQTNGARIFLPMEEKWYRRDATLLGNRQFLVLDPDGYLLRFFQDLGVRPAPR
jgi:catechol 2,3-dioxygenase-like lactoylglutathione lyase family enzyme